MPCQVSAVQSETVLTMPDIQIFTPLSAQLASCFDLSPQGPMKAMTGAVAIVVPMMYLVPVEREPTKLETIQRPDFQTTLAGKTTGKRIVCWARRPTVRGLAFLGGAAWRLRSRTNFSRRSSGFLEVNP